MNVLKYNSLLEDMGKHSEGISDNTLAMGGKNSYSVAKKAVPTVVLYIFIGHFHSFN